MNNNPLSYILILFTFLTLLLLFTTFTHATNTPHTTTTNLVTSTCKQTPDPTLCEATLRADPRSSKASNTQALTLIMIDVVKVRFMDSLNYVQDLTRKAHDPDTTRALQECIRVYKVVVDLSIDVAIRAVQQGDPKFGEGAMVDAGNEAEACRMGFSLAKVPGRIMGRTRILHGVSNVAASMIKTME